VFSPKYTISNTVLKNIGVIDASKELIASFAISKTWKEKLAQDAEEELIFYALSLEGIKLPEDYFSSSKEQTPDNQGSNIAASNFFNTLKSLREIRKQFEETNTYFLTQDTLLNLHATLSQDLIQADQAGQYRTRQLAIKNILNGEVVYSPPPSAEVPYLVEDLINFINSPEGKDLHPIIKAGVVQFEVYRVHPFAQFSNSVGLFLATLLLYLDGYGVEDALSFTEYFDATLTDYYKIMQSCARESLKETDERDITVWLEYFVKGVTLKILELKEKIERVAKDSHARDYLGEKVELTERQVMILDYLKKHGSMRNKDFRKIFPDFSDDTVLREVKFLKKKGLVKKEGNTKKATYVLA